MGNSGACSCHCYSRKDEDLEIEIDNTGGAKCSHAKLKVTSHIKSPKSRIPLPPYKPVKKGVLLRRKFDGEKDHTFRERVFSLIVPEDKPALMYLFYTYNKKSTRMYLCFPNCSLHLKRDPKEDTLIMHYSQGGQRQWELQGLYEADTQAWFDVIEESKKKIRPHDLEELKGKEALTDVKTGRDTRIRIWDSTKVSRSVSPSAFSKQEAYRGEELKGPLSKTQELISPITPMSQNSTLIRTPSSRQTTITRTNSSRIKTESSLTSRIFSDHSTPLGDSVRIIPQVIRTETGNLPLVKRDSSPMRSDSLPMRGPVSKSHDRPPAKKGDEKQNTVVII
mmetsp:Transcript_4729/g.7028  ORF Transcript_4729/g.7028 Transcript_4729/m.7028 type:complete len:336 (+) Transcript_4729:202-1209(+)|eukprot:CAMPEP_0167763140 /NCGR_PEP_ID=MMETSP0110_2-20121227/13180_1 /TAXON_ID=629695 /ORGANISM="Gymnochlora sp., Strain CCMP2014" /LENGTH=335 /DNA_ID=CAMNT_0007650137 /DNA_START=146 /DNA_END=1153 /DNA_ORIENTATION=-